MADYLALEAACRKKISAEARNMIVAEIECCRALRENSVFGEALAFLLEREEQIDAALNHVQTDPRLADV